MKSQHGGDTPVEVKLVSHVAVMLKVHWVSSTGEERNTGLLYPGSEHGEKSYPGHLFVVRTMDDRLVSRIRVNATNPKLEVEVERCDGLPEEEPLETDRFAEFEALARNAGSECVGHSSQWSCVRYVSPEELRARDRKAYGFSEEEAATTKGKYSPFETEDKMWPQSLPYVPNVTAYEGGWLKMEMPAKLKEALLPWYQWGKSQKILKREKKIEGYYTNDEQVPSDHLSLDTFPNVTAVIVTELGQVLQWWTKMRLRHTASYGIRIYRRGSMLLDHNDKPNTHLASAVLQVAQTVDEGWPLEVKHPHLPGLMEVYLQPGEMVLYEGARLLHGRPMRFKGDEFANVFTHFCPVEYRGPDTSQKYTHFAAKPFIMGLPRPNLEL